MCLDDYDRSVEEEIVQAELEPAETMEMAAWMTSEADNEADDEGI